MKDFKEAIACPERDGQYRSKAHPGATERRKEVKRFDTMTAEEYQAMAHDNGIRRANKMGAVRTEWKGRTYHSKREAERAAELQLLEKAGEIKDLEYQPKFVLQEAFVDQDGTRHRALTYTADFRYVEPGNPRPVVEDAKGYETRQFKDKWKQVIRMYGDRYEFRKVK